MRYINTTAAELKAGDLLRCRAKKGKGGWATLKAVNVRGGKVVARFTKALPEIGSEVTFERKAAVAVGVVIPKGEKKKANGAAGKADMAKTVTALKAKTAKVNGETKAIKGKLESQIAAKAEADKQPTKAERAATMVKTVARMKATVAPTKAPAAARPKVMRAKAPATKAA